MKTSLLMLASLALGTAAIAQDMPATQTPSATATVPDATTPAAPANQSAPAPAATDTTPAATNTAAPDTSAMPAPAAPDATATAAATDTSSYPTCSRSVTDKCVQRGAAHHRK